MPKHSATESEAFAAYQISRVMTYGLRELYRLFKGDITMAIVLGELGQHVTPHYSPGVRQDEQPKGLRRSNAHSISIASGIPRETVRRKIDKLIAMGWVVELPDRTLSLNRDIEIPLHQQFVSYNKEVLSRMRETVGILEGIEL